MLDRFSRSNLILGNDGMKRLSESRVAVFGLGGVGSFCTEALARAGIGALDLIEPDVISKTNINRQLYALGSTVGMSKAEVAKNRIEDIHLDCTVRIFKTFYLPNTADEFDFSQYDYIVDAIDTVSGKLCIIEQAYKVGTPVISCMGTGNKLDPTAFRVADIYQTNTDPLARVLRKELKKRNIPALKVVYSAEKARRPDEAKLQVLMQKELSEDSSRRDLPGSVSFVPGVAGMIAAGEVIKDIVGII